MIQNKNESTQETQEHEQQQHHQERQNATYDSDSMKNYTNTSSQQIQPIISN